MNIIKSIQLKTLFLFTFVSSLSITAQTVDLVANVDATPPLTVGQTFTYTLQSIAGTTEYQGVQIYLEYNPAVIQLNSLTPDNSVLTFPLANDTSTPGIIIYSAGSFTPVSGTTTVFTAVFEVIGTSEDVMITHDLESGGNPNGTAAGNSGGINITGTANDIILATLSVDQNTFNDDLSVYPNPVNDVLYIKTNTSSEVENIKIHTIDGKLIYQINDVNNNNNNNNNLLHINTSKLDEALYFVTITSVQKKIARFKILVNRN